jgi:hypothetical protein
VTTGAIESGPMAAAVRESKSGVRRNAEFRHALEGALNEAAADDRTMTLLRATRMRIRLNCPDIGLVLNVCAGDDASEPLRWAFSDEIEWTPKLLLEMDSDVANGYLQERESLAVAIARGRIKTSGDAKAALLYIPALRLLTRPYRRVVTDEHPQLALD